MGAIGGIMICDYWVIRRRRLDLPALFDPRGRYSYGGSGVNWRAVIALVVAVAPCIPGFLRALAHQGNVPESQQTFAYQLYVYSCFVTFTIGFVVYLLLMIGQRQQHPGAE
jgi:NCS1 family nucleobase:cation symporter-1